MRLIKEAFNYFMLIGNETVAGPITGIFDASSILVGKLVINSAEVPDTRLHGVTVTGACCEYFLISTTTHPAEW